MFNANELAMRDPAMAALLGVAPGNGANFGNESQFGWDAPGAEGFFGADFFGDFGADFGADGFFGADFGAEGFFGADFGYIGADAAPTPGAPPANPTQQQAMALWQKARAAHMHTSRRKNLLQPNAGSSVKVERFQLSLNQTLTLGTAATINMTQQPDTELRGQRIFCNAPVPGFVYFSEVKVANVSVTQGQLADAFAWSAGGWGVQMDLPTLTPSNRVTALGQSTVLIPPGYVAATAFIMTLQIIGPASMTG